MWFKEQITVIGEEKVVLTTPSCRPPYLLKLSTYTRSCQMREDPSSEEISYPLRHSLCPHPLSVFVSDSPSQYLKGLFCVMLSAPLHREFTGSNCSRPDILQQRVPTSGKMTFSFNGGLLSGISEDTQLTQTPALHNPFQRSKDWRSLPTTGTIGLSGGSVRVCLSKRFQTDSSFIT